MEKYEFENRLKAEHRSPLTVFRAEKQSCRHVLQDFTFEYAF